MYPDMRNRTQKKTAPPVLACTHIDAFKLWNRPNSIYATGTRIPDYVVELDEIVEERSLDSFANEWWKWIFSMQQSQSPVRYRDGIF
jgi:hypothetical protein